MKRFFVPILIFFIANPTFAREEKIPKAEKVTVVVPTVMDVKAEGPAKVLLEEFKKTKLALKFQSVLGDSTNPDQAAIILKNSGGDFATYNFAVNPNEIAQYEILSKISNECSKLRDDERFFMLGAECRANVNSIILNVNSKNESRDLLFSKLVNVANKRAQLKALINDLENSFKTPIIPCKAEMKSDRRNVLITSQSNWTVDNFDDSVITLKEFTSGRLMKVSCEGIKVSEMNSGRVQQILRNLGIRSYNKTVEKVLPEIIDGSVPSPAPRKKPQSPAANQ